MRPPILQWKVSLGLVAVVIAAVSLGSALDSSGSPHRTPNSHRVSSQGLTATGGIYSAKCGNVETELQRFSSALRPYLRRELRQVCQPRIGGWTGYTPPGGGTVVEFHNLMKPMRCSDLWVATVCKKQH